MNTKRASMTALLLALLLGQGMLAQGVSNMTLRSNFGRGEGDSKAVFAAGSLVFYALGSKMQIASFSNPASPVKIASVMLSDVIEFLVRTSISSTQYIVASGGNKLWLINVQDPTRPSLVSTTTVGIGVTCEGLATSGSYAYVAAGSGGLKIYNIANPASPTLVASLENLEYCESVVISSPYAYVAANTTSTYEGKSHIIDISNPASPVVKSTFTGYGGYHQYMGVRGSYAYICDYNAGLQVINVSDPMNPTNVTNIPSGFRTAGIIFDGNYAYLAVGDSGVYVYNLTNAASPVLAGKIITPGRAAFLSFGAITVGGSPVGHVYVANRVTSGVCALNVSTPSAPTLSSFLIANQAATGTAYTPAYANGKVYVAYGTAGLRIVDVSNPAAIALLSTVPLGGDSRAVAVSGATAYVAARDSGVHVVDVSNASAAVRLSTIRTPRARGIAVSGSYLYVAASDSGLGIFDISTPTSPILIGYSHPGGQYGENVAAAGNIIGLTDYSKILFFDATSPAAPVAKGLTPSLRVGNEGFAIEGTFAYVPDGDSLKVFNLSNLLTPTLVGKVYTGGYGYAASVSGQYCYVASEGTGVRAIDITNPASPVEAGYYDDVPQSRGVVASGEYVYVAEKTDGLTVYSNNLVTAVSREGPALPAAYVLEQNFPNPFNPETRIRFSIPTAEMVTLRVFDLLGREVAVLVHQKLGAGTHVANFDAARVPSGIYVYTLAAGSKRLSQRMLVLK